MKKFLLLSSLAVFTASAIQAQITNSPTPSSDERYHSYVVARARATPLKFELFKPNEAIIAGHRVSGILVEAAKTHQPWQLLNPAAGPEFGEAEDNLLRGLATTKPLGLKVFSIRL